LDRYRSTSVRPANRCRKSCSRGPFLILRPTQANLPRQIVKRSAHRGTLQAPAVIIERGVVQGNPSVSCGGDSAVYIAVRDHYNWRGLQFPEHGSDVAHGRALHLQFRRIPDATRRRCGAGTGFTAAGAGDRGYRLRPVPPVCSIAEDLRAVRLVAAAFREAG
jgi:hypothetical protein